LLSFITDYQEAREVLPDERPTPLIGFSFVILMFFASVVRTIMLHQVYRLTLHLAWLIDKKANSISRGSPKPASGFAPVLSPLSTKRL
jgi:hypothetical protein